MGCQTPLPTQQEPTEQSQLEATPTEGQIEENKSEPFVDGGVESSPEAGVELALENEPEAIPERTPQPPTTFPLRPMQVQRLGPGRKIDVRGVFWQQAGRLHTLFESFDVSHERGQMYQADWEQGQFSPPKVIEVSQLALASSPSVVRWAGEDWLYFTEATGIYNPVNLRRVRLADGGLKAFESLPAIKGVASTLSWPKFFVRQGSPMIVAFRDARYRPMLSFSEDGKRFRDPVLVGPEQGGAMPAAAISPEGAFFYTYQYDTPTAPMLSFVRTSQDGKQWGTPQRVSTASSNVHDTTIHPRAGGADLYYIYPKGSKGFVLFRRFISNTGRLGPEQQLTDDTLGEVSKPEVFHHPDGRLFVAWSEISQRDFQGFPDEQTYQVAIIYGDAPTR